MIGTRDMSMRQSERIERIDCGVGSQRAIDNAPICPPRKIASVTARKKDRRPSRCSLIVRVICGHEHSPRHSGTATGRLDDTSAPLQRLELVSGRFLSRLSLSRSFTT
ncbi:hypothetical protein MRX96_040106 [Rhipicephalus microplus]